MNDSVLLFAHDAVAAAPEVAAEPNALHALGAGRLICRTSVGGNPDLIEVAQQANRVIRE